MICRLLTSLTINSTSLWELWTRLSFYPSLWIYMSKRFGGSSWLSVITARHEAMRTGFRPADHADDGMTDCPASWPLIMASDHASDYDSRLGIWKKHEDFFGRFSDFGFNLAVGPHVQSLSRFTINQLNILTQMDFELRQHSDENEASNYRLSVTEIDDYCPQCDEKEVSLNSINTWFFFNKMSLLIACSKLTGCPQKWLLSL